MASTAFLLLSALSAFLREEYATIISKRNTPCDCVCVWLLCGSYVKDYMVMQYYCFVVCKDQGPTGFEGETVIWKGLSQARQLETRESNPGVLVGWFSWTYQWSLSYIRNGFLLGGVHSLPLEVVLGWGLGSQRDRIEKLWGSLNTLKGQARPGCEPGVPARSYTSGWAFQLLSFTSARSWASY